MESAEEHWYRAVESRDSRFDGWIYLGVTSTGIYCRPSCPAVMPKRPNVEFFPTSAAAQQQGYRQRHRQGRERPALPCHGSAVGTRSG